LGGVQAKSREERIVDFGLAILAKEYDPADTAENEIFKYVNFFPPPKTKTFASLLISAECRDKSGYCD